MHHATWPAQGAAAAVLEAMDPMIKARMDGEHPEHAIVWRSLDRHIGSVMGGEFPPEMSSDDEDGYEDSVGSGTGDEDGESGESGSGSDDDME